MSENGKTRVQLDLPPTSMERLRVLREKTEAGNYAEVLRNALRLYEALVSEAEKGGDVLVRDKEGKETRVFM